MYRVAREIDFCYGHRLLNYEGKCKNLHGHNGLLIVTFEVADLDHRGMVIDFGDIKRIISQWVDDHLDHRMILCRHDPVVPVLQSMGEPLFLMEENPTAENISRLIFEFAASQGLPIVETALYETPRCVAVYRPTDRT